MTKDQFTLWVLSGIAGVITRDTYSFFARKIGFAKFYIWHQAASIFTARADLTTVWGHVIGFFADIIIGGMFGVFTGLLLKWQGTKNYIIKGWGVGGMAWLFLYGLVYHNLPFTKASAPAEAVSNLSAFIGHSVFGITTAVVYVKWLSKYALETDNNNKNTNGELPGSQVIYVEVEKPQPSILRRIKNRFVRKIK
ncbi:MAG: hypothetical protein CVU89_14740 [Firmicutes bacterium HGW-Firmicutes-14]|nr:MAG: hypothetical protein CVU89_14740 [Firmicutes bacterium HGW-Firmicutes-14]